MIDNVHYPELNDRPHERPILAMYGDSPLGELIWVLIPVAIVVIALLMR